MRTTVLLDDDVAAAVQRMRAERNIGLSEAVNELARAGLAVPSQRTRNLGRDRRTSCSNCSASTRSGATW
jgi:hypothetical protein